MERCIQAHGRRHRCGVVQQQDKGPREALSRIFERVHRLSISAREVFMYRLSPHGCNIAFGIYLNMYTLYDMLLVITAPRKGRGEIPFCRYIATKDTISRRFPSFDYVVGLCWPSLTHLSSASVVYE